MRRLMLGAATAAIAVVAGCSMLGKQAFQQPIVHLQDVRVNGVGLTGGNLDVKLRRNHGTEGTGRRRLS